MKESAVIVPKLIFTTIEGSPRKKSIPNAHREYSIITMVPTMPVRWVLFADHMVILKMRKAARAEYSWVGWMVVW